MNDLTKKQKGFVEDYIETGNGTQAALNNYDTDDYSTAGNIASDNLKKPKIVNAINSIAERIPEDKLVKVLLEGLEAEKKVFKNNNATGTVDEVATEPDHPTRHKFLDTSLKLRGDYAPEKQTVTVELDATPRLKQIAHELRLQHGN